MKLPSSSLRATKTSSSSSTDSAMDALGDDAKLEAGGRGQLTIEERDELFSRALGTEGEGDGGEAVNSVESEQDVIVLGGTKLAGPRRGEGGKERLTLSSSMSTAMGYSSSLVLGASAMAGERVAARLQSRWCVACAIGEADGCVVVLTASSGGGGSQVMQSLLFAHSGSGFGCCVGGKSA